MKHKEDLNEQEIILDATYCIRVLPAKLLLTLDYFEKYLNIKVNHLYYGKVNDEDKNNNDISKGELIDFIKFFHESKVAESLRQFKDTLKLSNAETIYEEEPDLKKLLDVMYSLNDYLELADYENTKNSIIEISDLSLYLLECKEMKRIKIYLESIHETFNIFNKDNDDLYILKKIAKLLCEYGYNQLACTFVYQKYELWLEKYLGIELNKKGSFHTKLGKTIMKKLNENEKQNKNFFEMKIKAKYEKEYNQLLLNYIKTLCNDFYVQHSKDIKDLLKYCSNVQDDIVLSLLPYLIYESYVCIAYFANQVRNRLNHAKALKEKMKIKNEFTAMFYSIERLYEVAKK